MKKFYITMTVLLMGVCLSGCNWTDDDFLGTWESYAYYDGYEEYNIYGIDRVRYTFYDDGTGLYVQNNGLRTHFEWHEYRYGHFYLRHSDGLTEDLYYRFDRGDLIMSDSPNFYTYTVYRYSSYY